MTYREIKAVKVYDAEGLAAAGKAAQMTHAEVLHVVGEYRKRRRSPHPECEWCRFRSGGQPCVLPIGICGLEAYRRRNRR